MRPAPPWNALRSDDDYRVTASSASAMPQP